MNWRLDRLLTLYLLRPWTSHHDDSPRIPVLMYHSISAESRTGLAYYRTATPPRIFAEHLRWLQREGFESVNLHGLVQSLKKTQEDRRLVVITFDDGYADFLTDAFPLLSAHGFLATVFLPTSYIGKTRRKFRDHPCLSWAEVRELRSKGIEFGSHTASHPQLWRMATPAIQQELETSKKTIEDQLGIECTGFAYPFAFPQTQHSFVRSLRHLLEDAGYRQGVCTAIGTTNRNSDPLFLERLPMNGTDDPEFLSAKVRGAYNWMGGMQRVRQMIR